MPRHSRVHPLRLVLCLAFLAVSNAVQAAEILRISPTVIPPEGGTTVTISGNGFARGDVARIDGKALTSIRVESAERLTGRSPALLPGTYTVDIRSVAGAVKATRRNGITVQEPDTLRIALERLKGSSRTPLTSMFRQGFPQFVQGRIPVSGADMYARSQDFLKRFGSLYGLEADGIELRFKKAVDLDHETVKFSQTYDGIPVHGASLLVALYGDEVLFTIGKLFQPGRRLGTLPRISSDKAIEVARKALGLARAPLAADPQLMILDLGLLTDQPSEPHLAWKVLVGRRRPFRVFVDAGRGTVLLKTSLLEDNGSSLHGFDLDIEDAEEEANAQWDGCFALSSDTEVATESWFSPDYFDDPDAVMARNGAKEAYKFYHERFNWHSYDNDSSELNVFIHADTDGGAQWVSYCDLIQIQTGRPSMDTLAHELTHGIIARGSDLDYEFQPGALNEHYADAMACISDRMREGENADWTHAEDRTSGELKVRDFADPTTKGQPDHMSGLSYLYDDDEGEYLDNGGVHFNSGIANKAFFLMIQGGNFKGYLAPGGLTLAKAARLKWAAIHHLEDDAHFIDARNYEVAVATFYRDNDLHGFTADDVCAIKIAWAAVGVGPDQFGPTCNGKDFVDTDGDGVTDSEDNCDTVENPLQEDTDHDLLGNACDDDLDNDGFKNSVDTCPGKYNPLQGACWDYDNDKVSDLLDNCVFDANPGQADTDGDGEGDACEVDTDGDTINVPDDNCPVVPNTDQLDTDGDGFGDACDRCPNTADEIWAFGLDGRPYQPDTDEDGIPDACDNGYRVNGALGGLLVVSNDAGSSQVEVEAKPESVLRMPIHLCPDGCPEWYPPGQVIDVALAGLDPDILAYITNENGEVESRGPQGPPEGLLRFAPRGGGRYYLNFEFGPRYAQGGLVNLVASLINNAEPELPPSFRRGDSNSDGDVNISDSLRTLNFLFLGGSQPDCMDAADANDDNKVNLSDPVFALTFLFLGGTPLPDPGGENCGQDPTDSIGCASYPGC